MKLVILDAATLGGDVSLDDFNTFGELSIYHTTKQSQIVERCEHHDIVITNKVKFSADELSKLPELKLICLAATGMDNIDLVECEKRNITVKNVKGYSTDSVAQITVSMVMSLASRLSEHNKFGKEQWVNDEIFTNLGSPFFELANKTWAVIGLGDIGRKTAEIAKAIGCNVVYYSTSGKNSTNDYKRVELDEALQSDIITVHCPLNENTRNLINKSNLHNLKDNAILVNVARGGIISERDIVDKFKSSNISLGFDVASVEPILKDNPLLEIKKSERFILTPHIAWSSKEARTRLIDCMVENIKGWL